MAIGQQHELHRRRRGRNIGVALALFAFVAIVFGLSIAKLSRGDLTGAYNAPPAVLLENKK